MTVFLRALHGPFGPFDENEHVDWFFFGIREDNTVGRWAVRFQPLRRTFTIVNFQVGASVRAGKSWLELPKDVVHPDAFVPDGPMLYGETYLAILKPRLSKADIALATRLAIEAAR